MRFAIFGDIHANLEALQAVLADAEAHGVTHYVCLGDVVGYGAEPDACTRLVRERAAVWKAIADGVAELGGLDIVVANAGIYPMGKRQTIQ